MYKSTPENVTKLSNKTFFKTHCFRKVFVKRSTMNANLILKLARTSFTQLFIIIILIIDEEDIGERKEEMRNKGIIE